MPEGVLAAAPSPFNAINMIKALSFGANAVAMLLEEIAGIISSRVIKIASSSCSPRSEPGRASHEHDTSPNNIPYPTEEEQETPIREPNACISSITR